MTQKLGALARDQRGNIQYAMLAIVGGVLILVVGLILADMVLDQIGKAAGSLGEPTYSDIVDHDSAGSINSLLALLYYIVLITLGIGMIGGGGYGRTGPRVSMM